MSDATKPLRFTHNGREVSLPVDADETLLTTLRERLDDPSVRGCCNIGVCGTCTVLVDGKPTSSCIALSRMCEDAAVETAVGADERGGLAAEAQEAFVAERAFQCSYCIPAMALSVEALAAELGDAEATEDDLRHWLDGNLCRCGAYASIIRAASMFLASRRAAADGGEPSSPQASAPGASTEAR